MSSSCCRTSGATAARTASACSSATSTSSAPCFPSCPTPRSLYWLYLWDLFTFSLLAWRFTDCSSRLLNGCFLCHSLFHHYLIGCIFFLRRQRLLTALRTALLLVRLKSPSEGDKLLNVLGLFNPVQLLEAVLHFREEGMISWLLRHGITSIFLFFFI